MNERLQQLAKLAEKELNPDGSVTILDRSLVVEGDPLAAVLPPRAKKWSALRDRMSPGAQARVKERAREMLRQLDEKGPQPRRREP